MYALQPTHNRKKALWLKAIHDYEALLSRLKSTIRTHQDRSLKDIKHAGIQYDMISGLFKRQIELEDLVNHQEDPGVAALLYMALKIVDIEFIEFIEQQSRK